MPSPRYWREIPARYRLEGARCKSCGKVDYPALNDNAKQAYTELVG